MLQRYYKIAFNTSQTCFMQIMSIMNELKNNNETAAVRQEQLKAIQADLSKVAGTVMS